MEIYGELILFLFQLSIESLFLLTDLIASILKIHDKANFIFYIFVMVIESAVFFLLTKGNGRKTIKKRVNSKLGMTSEYPKV